MPGEVSRTKMRRIFLQKIVEKNPAKMEKDLDMTWTIAVVAQEIPNVDPGPPHP
jgi:hypothetical protein